MFMTWRRKEEKKWVGGCGWGKPALRIAAKEFSVERLDMQLISCIIEFICSL
jgi:hypothetical protein